MAELFYFMLEKIYPDAPRSAECYFVDHNFGKRKQCPAYIEIT